jgi:hypothetical protein
MSMTQSAISRAPRPSSLADVLDLLLDKGLVIDAYVRVSALGIEVLTIDARVVVASVDTYLRFAEAVNRLDISHTETKGLPELMQDMRGGGGNGEESKVKGALEGGKEALQEWRGERQEERQQGNGRRADDRSRNQEEQSSSRRSSRRGNENGNDEGTQGEGADRQGLLSRIADRGRWS